MTDQKRIDDMDLGDLTSLALADGGDIPRVYLLRAAVLGRQAERRLVEFERVTKAILPVTVAIASRRAARRSARVATLRERRRASR